MRTENKRSYFLVKDLLDQPPAKMLFTYRLPSVTPLAPPVSHNVWVDGIEVGKRFVEGYRVLKGRTQEGTEDPLWAEEDQTQVVVVIPSHYHWYLLDADSIEVHDSEAFTKIELENTKYQAHNQRRFEEAKEEEWTPEEDPPQTVDPNINMQSFPTREAEDEWLNRQLRKQFGGESDAEATR